MRSGDLRHRITFQTNTPTVNSSGETVDTFADAFTVWGAIEPLSGNRLFAAQQANSEAKGVVRVRYRDDILATMRMLYGTRILQIISIINPDTRPIELLLLFKEALD